MSQAATREDIDEVIGIVKDFMAQSAIQLDNVNKRLDRFDEKYDHLITVIDGFISRIDKYETEIAARDAQFERLLDWARQVSAKVGVPLKDL